MDIIIGTAELFRIVSPRVAAAQIKAAGFDFLNAVYFGREPLSLWAEECRRVGLHLDAIYTPSSLLNQLWIPGDAGDAAVADLCNCAETVGRLGVDKMILQAALELPPSVSQCGLDRFRRLAEFAKERGVRLCFENRKSISHLEVLLAVLEPYHGFCWNVAHNAGYTPQIDYLGKYADRLLSVCLEDWLAQPPEDTAGKAKMHLLPFDGDVDWERTARHLSKIGYTGAYVANAIPDGRMTYEAFLADAYAKVRRICLRIRELQRELCAVKSEQAAEP